MKNYKVKLTSIYDILNVIDSCQNPWPMNILITGKYRHHQIYVKLIWLMSNPIMDKCLKLSTKTDQVQMPCY